MTGVRATKEVEFVGNCRDEAGAFSDRFYPALRRPVPLFFSSIAADTDADADVC